MTIVTTNRTLSFPGSCILALLKAVAIQSSKDACYEQMELYNGNKFTEHLFQQDCKFMPSDQGSLYYASIILDAQKHIIPQIMLAASNKAYLESNFYWQPELNYISLWRAYCKTRNGLIPRTHRK